MDSDPARLRILQVNSRLDGGGADNQTLELTGGLHAVGEDVWLAVAAGSRWENRARSLGVPVTTFVRHSPLKSAQIRTCASLIRQHDIQIVHAHQGSDYWPAVAAARLAGRAVRVIITRHLMTRPRTFSRWFLLRCADLIAVSRAVEGVLHRELHGPRQRIHQIYGGIDVSRFLPQRTEAAWEFRRQNGWTDQAVVFAVVGGFMLPRGKGQPEFLEAAHRIKDTHPRASFVIVGEGTMEDWLRARIQALGLAGRAGVLRFTEEIPVLMSAIDVLVHPAVGTEAFPLVTLEAMASGRPVIASRLDGIPEGVRDGTDGLLAPPGDVSALADRMARLCAEPELRRQMGAAAADHVRANFTRETLVRRTRELYLSLSRFR
jgi:glycosyltransferase involved in cell wall biosynthesis